MFAAVFFGGTTQLVMHKSFLFILIIPHMVHNVDSDIVNGVTKHFIKILSFLQQLFLYRDDIFCQSFTLLTYSSVGRDWGLGGSQRLNRVDLHGKNLIPMERFKICEGHGPLPPSPVPTPMLTPTYYNKSLQVMILMYVVKHTQWLGFLTDGAYNNIDLQVHNCYLIILT